MQNRSFHRVVTAALAAVVLCGGKAAAAQSAEAGPAAARKSLETLYQREARIWTQKDPKAVRSFYESILAPDFTDNTRGTLRKRRDFLGDMEQDAREVKSLAVDQKIQRLTVQANSATALVRHSEQGVLMDHRGRNHRFTEVGLVRQVLARIANRWMLKRRESVRKESSLVDGKPLPRH